MVQQRKSTTIRKQQIIEAARKLIIKKGSEHLTVRAIASVVNITEAAIYRHFKSKREILSFLMTTSRTTCCRSSQANREQTRTRWIR